MYLIVLTFFFLPALFIASFESEGPENHMEKDSWKTLRYEASSEHESFCRHTEACDHQLLLSYLHTQLKTII